MSTYIRTDRNLILRIWGALWNEYLIPDDHAPASQKSDSRPSWRLPACIPIDQNKVTDFGQQVATQLTMEADRWQLAPDLSCFIHPELGRFEFGEDDTLRHYGANVAPGSLVPPGKQRMLTTADRDIIADALAACATRGFDATPVPAATDGKSTMFRQSMPPSAISANKGDVWQDIASGRTYVFDGGKWRDPSDGAVWGAGQTLTASALQAQAQQMQQSLYNQQLSHYQHVLSDPTLLAAIQNDPSLQRQLQSHMADAMNYGLSARAMVATSKPNNSLSLISIIP